jgi:GntR family transcriptional regulator/MocR family aminotransferase
VARNTVALAYQDLVAEGFLVARERRGYFVNGDILAGRVRPPPTPAPSAAPDWERRFCLRPSSQRNIVKPRDWQRFPYPFIYGQIDPALFPLADWRECSRQALAVEAVRDWAVDRFTEDDPLLIEQIRTRLLPRRGVRAAPEEILLTVGAQHALYLVASLLVREGTTVGIEDPGYADARNILSLRTRAVRALPVDAEGLLPDAPLAGCDYVYATPSHQFPTTATLSLPRREALIARARAEDFVLIEDDYESEINHVGTPHPALKSLDPEGRVIYVASLSKTLAPGLRMGFLVGPRPFVEEARALRRLMLRHPPANNQRTVALFLARGHHDSLMRRLSHAFRDRWRKMGEALARHLPECRFPPTTGGTAYWVTGPEGLDSEALARAAARRGVLIEPGAVHFQAADAPRRYFRLGFSSIPVDRIEPGLKLLGEAMREQLR